MSICLELPTLLKTRIAQRIYEYFPPPHFPRGLFEISTQINETKLTRAQVLIRSLRLYPWNSLVEKSTDLSCRLFCAFCQMHMVLENMPNAGFTVTEHPADVTDPKNLIIENDEYNWFNPYRTSLGIQWKISEEKNLDPSMIVRVDSYTMREQLLKEDKQKQQQTQQVYQLATSLQSLSTGLRELEPPEEQEGSEKDANTDTTESGEYGVGKQRPEKEAKKIRQAIRRQRQKAKHQKQLIPSFIENVEWK